MITDNYIKMCEQAEEMQKAWNPKQFDCYYGKDMNHVFILEELSLVNIIEKYIEAYTWLPTQEQLQEISGIPWWRFDKRCDGVRCCLLEDPLNNIKIRTKEEAGICVVMEKKYNKIWNGEKWERINQSPIR